MFAYSKLPLTTWFLALYLLTQQKNAISALELKRQLGVSYATAWSVKHKLLQTMLERDANRQLTGVIEVDDVYWGRECHGQTPGRGSPNKRPPSSPRWARASTATRWPCAWTSSRASASAS